MAVSKSTWVLVAGASALVAGVLWMPRTPASAPKPPVTEGVALEDIGTDPVDIAVAKVSGENPMEGILALRALADEMPPNLDAVAASQSELHSILKALLLISVGCTLSESNDIRTHNTHT